jgi:hypothetical protein
MKGIVFMWIFILTLFAGNNLCGIIPDRSEIDFPSVTQQDTLKENQNLYTGKVWINNYHRVEGDQFLFSGFFMPGTVSTNGKTYKNLRIKYDIYSDEIITPVNSDDILQLNKEMIDSFSINFENKEYKFTRIREDTLNGLNGLKGYFCILYNQESALYIKYKKNISPNITEKSDGKFIKNHKIYLVRKNIISPIASVNDLYKALDADNEQIRNYLKKNKLKVSKNRPESFIPAIRFYDNLSRQQNIK